MKKPCSKTLAAAESAKITVIGGGIAGITAAHELAVAGHEVSLVESSERLGGLGTYFDWNGHWIDKFYHCQMPSDDDLLQLIDDLGISDRMYWKQTRMGFLVGNKRFAFNGALDLLKFSPLTFLERIRFGVVSLLLRQLGKGKDLDHMRIEDWLSGIYGKSIWEKLLKPLFVSKFGPAAGDMPALYIWERLGREKNTASRGYLKSGLKFFLDTAEARLKDLGVEVIKEAKVSSIDEVGDGVIITTLHDQRKIVGDWCISTIPLPLLQHVLDGTSLEEKVRIPDVPYQGVVNAMFFLKRPLDNYYWAPVMGCGTEFDGIVEMTELIETGHYAGHHCAYVMKYCDRNCDLFQEDEKSIALRWKQQLIDLYPDLQLTTADIEDVQVFKAPFVEPAYPLGYSEKKPAINENGNRLFLATSAQVYPRITAWNSSCWMAKNVVRELTERMAAEAGNRSGARSVVSIS
ncbi:MAG: NAD(P)-binding protein [Verrucomicrobiales bacterium]|nr:NAD(P)-binding protein [Verrucomicrobiales bacterium]